MGLKSWLSFRGRIPLRTYWLAYLLPLLGAYILAVVLDAWIFGAEWRVLPGLVPTAEATSFHAEFRLGGVLLAEAVFWLNCIPGFAGAARRWHDRGRSGWWSLLILLPVIGWIWMFISLCCRDGVRGPNRYGPDPLEG